jgi:hypothetical protein
MCPTCPIFVDRLNTAWKQLGAILFTESEGVRRGVVRIPRERSLRMGFEIAQHGLDKLVVGRN